ncbi:MAG: hypothetical protein FJZ01_04500 [Candidatus Sericytochromatia bacterium]|nr:hypothetical protein [Candidatus Tanganyikabacteria bacterium]
MPPLTFHWEWEIGASAAQVWPLISDTDRLNRVIGLPAVDWREEKLPGGGARRMGSFRVKGISFEWEEHPFQWRAEQGFSVRRAYVRGPILVQEIAVRLERIGALDQPAGGAGGTTRAVWDVKLEPRHPLLVPLMRFIAADLHRGLDQLHGRIDQQFRGSAVVAFPPEEVELQPEAPARLARAAAELQRLGLPADAAARLIDFLTTASLLDVQKMRAFSLADRWGLPRVATLKLFLHATRLGLLDLSWDMVCPHCRGGKQAGDNLSDLSEAAHCTSCNVDFETDFSRSVELTFHPNASIRQVTQQVFCVGGPQNTPHVVAQTLLEPGESAAWDLVLAPGAYRLRSPDAGSQATVEVFKGPRAATPTALELGAGGFAAPEAAVPGPECKLAVRNTAPGRHLVLLERTAWADHIVTADFVGTLPEFRTLFSEQVLAPGVKVKVARLAFLFTDLKSSTAMYEEQGDAKAFALVRDHFKVMEAPIAAEGGAVVKNIGDAIMAVFPDAASCFRAALAIQHGITEYNRTSGEVPLIIKAGAHVGPCLAVNLNDALDYFGTTVNVAARVQGESIGEDFVLTREMVEDPGVARLLAETPWEADRYAVQLKGLSDAFELTRLWPLRLESGVAAGLTSEPAGALPG